MARLKRFVDFRFVGDRDTMLVYDTDDEAQAEGLAIRAEAQDLWGKNLLQSFAPDGLEEAANRGFRAVRRAAG